MDIWVAGVGEIPCRPSYDEMDFREMLYRAAAKAYLDAGITPADVDGVVSSGMDFYEGMSITDSYTPDQVGGRLKFNTLVSNDALNAFIHACMLLKTGQFRTVLVTAYAKASNILNYPEIVFNSFDPHVVRPLTPHFYAIAAMDAQAYLLNSGGDARDLSLVAAKNKRNALRNPSAAFAENISIEEVESMEVVSEPLRKGHVAVPCDYAAAVLLTTEKSLGKVRVEAFGYSIGSYSVDLSLKEWGRSHWARAALEMALRQIRMRRVDFVEVSEPFAHTELMVLDGFGIVGENVCKTLRDGGFNMDGYLPVNPSGGCIGMGYPLNAAGLQRLVQSVNLLRTGRWSSCLVASPDGEVVDGGAVVVLSAEV
jgi:acetyl-CoA C-acetyltransferase